MLKCAWRRLRPRPVPRTRFDTADDNANLDEMQSAYKAEVDAWIAAIRAEEALASVNHSVAQVDQWEAAHFRAEDTRKRAQAAKVKYEAALREKFFNFR